MEENVDLEKDPKKFVEYQADEAYGQLAVIQRHFEWILAGKEVLFCLGCTYKHFQTLSQTCQECLGGACPAQPVWQEMSSWAEKTKDRVMELLRQKKQISEDEARQICQHARKYRKEMEKILIGEELPETEARVGTYTQEHVR